MVDGREEGTDWVFCDFFFGSSVISADFLALAILGCLSSS